MVRRTPAGSVLWPARPGGTWLTAPRDGTAGATKHAQVLYGQQAALPDQGARPLRCAGRAGPAPHAPNPPARAHSRLVSYPAYYTHQGTFLLSKNEPFEFSDRNKPLLYSAMINHTKAAFKLRIKVPGPVGAPPATAL